jgi:hypothetical protein
LFSTGHRYRLLIHTLGKVVDPEKAIFRQLEGEYCGLVALQGEHPVPYVHEAQQKNAPKSSEELVEVHRGGCQDHIDRISGSTLTTQ